MITHGLKVLGLEIFKVSRLNSKKGGGLPSHQTKIILGVDPGSYVTGFGLVALDFTNHFSAKKSLATRPENRPESRPETKIRYLRHGVIAPPRSFSFHARLGVIASEFELLIAELKPQVTVIERVFLGKNADSAFKLGHARGVLMAMATRANSEVIEYATRAVKKGITGRGSAEKVQVRTVLYSLLNLRAPNEQKRLSNGLDASDALALAFYHARQIEVMSMLNAPVAASAKRGEQKIEL